LTNSNFWSKKKPSVNSPINGIKIERPIISNKEDIKFKKKIKNIFFFSFPNNKFNLLNSNNTNNIFFSIYYTNITMDKIIHIFLQKIQAQKYVINKYGIIFFIINKIKVLLIKHIPNLTLLIIFFPIALTIRFISPFYLIRFEPLISARIGHYASRPELYLCEKKLKINTPKQKYTDFFFNMYEGSCNKYFEKVLKKKINIIPYRIGRTFYYLNRLFCFILKKNNIFEIKYTNKDYDVLNLFEKVQPQLKLNESDIQEGYEKLKFLGLNKNQKFVCILFRDNSYLKKKFPNADYSYHNYRNANIDNFSSAAKYLISKGYYIFRIGSVTNKKFLLNHPMIVDYANSDFKTDFLDIFLSHECSFFVSTGTGLDNAANIFRKPILYVNYVPIETIHLHSQNRNLSFIFKHHYSKKIKKKLSLREIFKEKLHTAYFNDIYKRKKIFLMENSKKELLGSTIEFEKKISKKFLKKKVHNYNQKKFWSTFEILIKKYSFYSKYQFKNYNAEISESFLNKNKYLLK